MTNLGVVLAQAGHKMLLLDAELRQAQLHQIFSVAQEPGLSTLLAKTGGYQAYIAETDLPNLHLLPGGSTPPDPLQLLSSPWMAWLIAEPKEEADIVFLNTPPILSAADAVVLAAQVDGMILVIESRSTRRQSATQALKMLRNVEADVLGVVLTRVRVRSSRYHYYSDFSKPEKQPQALLYRNHDGLGQTKGAILPLSKSVSEPLHSLDRI